MDGDLLAGALPTVLAGVLGFTGVLVGARITARDQYLQWLRQERLKVYAQYVALAQQALRVFLTEPTPTDGVPADRAVALTSVWAQADTVFAQVAIIGEPGTVEEGRRLAESLVTIVRQGAAIPGRTTSAMTDAASEVQSRINAFRDAAAKELGVGRP